MALEDDYEKLENDQVLSIQQFAWKGHLLSAKFGGGYAPAGAFAGDSDGLRKWTLSSECLPDDDSVAAELVTYSLAGGSPTTATRFDYLLEFFRRHIQAGNKPFVLKWRGALWMASFANTEIGFDVFTSEVFGGGGVVLNQRKVTDYTFNADGSLDDAPLNLILSPPATKQMDIDWDPVTYFAADHYEILRDGVTTIVTPDDTTFYTDTGLTTAQEYCYKVRAVDADGNVTNWSAQVCETAT